MTDHEVTFHEGTHTYGIDGEPVPSVTQVLKEAGIINTKFYTAWGRHRGSTVHKAIEFHAQGVLELNSIDPKIRGYLDAYERFLLETKYEPVEIERLVYSVAGRYAGTLDQIGKIGREKIMPDFKTGPPAPANGLQLTGYADAYQEETGEYVSKLMGVHLQIDGRYKIKPYIADFSTWRGALRVAWWKREN